MASGGVFTELVGALGITAVETNSLAWDDMDGDGDLDLAVSNYGQMNQMYQNNGSGVFMELVGALEACASFTRAIIRANIESSLFFTTMISRYP